MTVDTQLAAWRDVMSEALPEMDAWDAGAYDERAEQLLALQRNIAAALAKIEKTTSDTGDDLKNAKQALSLIVVAWMNATKLRDLGYTGREANVEAFNKAASYMRDVVADEEKLAARRAKMSGGSGTKVLAP